MNYQDKNAETIDRWIEEGWEWGTPIDHETYEKAKSGEWDVVLTPTKPDQGREAGMYRGNASQPAESSKGMCFCRQMQLLYGEVQK